MALSDDEVRRRVLELEGWEYDGTDLVRLLVRSSFRDAIDFVNRVADLADAADHHPNIDIRYDAVRLTLHTHSEKGVTEKDFALAKEIDRAASGT